MYFLLFTFKENHTNSELNRPKRNTKDDDLFLKQT